MKAGIIGGFHMSKIVVNDLSYHYIEHFNPVFEHVNLVLDTEWKLGLIGRNGRGKSTFLNLLNGTLKPDRGIISMKVQTELFPYEINQTYKKTMDVIKETIGGLKTMEDRMEEIISANDESRMEEYQEILADYLELDGFNIESKIRRELNLMELSEELLERDYEVLSGGEKTKMQIISLFLRKNAFILLDEPTNHLDIEGKSSLIHYLQGKKGFILVSHDREFLDQVIDHVLSINKTDIELEKGNYSSWKKNTQQKETFEFKARTRLQKEIKTLEEQALNKRDWAEIAESTKNQHGKFQRSSGSKAAQFMKHAKNAESKAEKNLEEKKQLLKNYEVAAELIIRQEILEENQLVKVKDLSFGYNQKPFIRNLSFTIHSGDRIWIRGGNGCGKSTLLKLIAGYLKVENAIEYSENLAITETYQEPLWREGYIKEFVSDREHLENIIAFCHCFDLSDATLQRPIETWSGGEKRKLDIARALSDKNQLILLDEPLNYMDVYFREQLEAAILKDTPTIVFVEHDERFGKNIANKIIDLGI